MFQQFALAALGVFVFMRHTTPFQSLSREVSWRHPTNSVIGAMPKTQFLGKEGERITLQGRLAPEITGGRISLQMLETMAEMGDAYPLIDGASFALMGYFVVEKISEERSELFGDGAPRLIDFSVTLKRVDDPLAVRLSEMVMKYL
ncbi:phage tail protein [Gallibacterium anatis]|uniref:Phage tail protein n=1 Tax=Gallibacterium anatis TaxID=750 RepID=A0A0A2X0Y7_9PAST|nr:phage tail protein [Gallibacterium anatis]KGQ24265.1 oxidoreductase [Gallibacterium anatis]KGQ46373.1 oxidoreductase [Gallibacterium anatis]KGQ49251.1 oxidoreductase [Gallibacterium anatis 10672-6]KGQ50107.1 oxidoreductase [Gallibacterium anatis]KGQ64958.1 oxidoreductase [Gallibacterium anatis 7990]